VGLSPVLQKSQNCSRFKTGLAELFYRAKVFGIIDFTAGYHHPDSQEYTAFITQYGLFE
jgi:hypothetical protein